MARRWVERDLVVELLAEASRYLDPETAGQVLDARVNTWQAGGRLAAVVADTEMDAAGGCEQWFRRDTVEEMLRNAPSVFEPNVGAWIDRYLAKFPPAVVGSGPHAEAGPSEIGRGEGARPLHGLRGLEQDGDPTPKVSDEAIVAAAVKHASVLDIRERALRLGLQKWPDGSATHVIEAATEFERWLGRAADTDTGEKL
jgi:hypothetical protein